MKKRMLAGLFLVLAGFSAHAANVQLIGSKATGITGLEIDGAFYDVLFERVTGITGAPFSLEPCVIVTEYCDLFAEDPVDPMAAAEAAVAAIRTALGATPLEVIATTVGPSDSSFEKPTYKVPYQAGKLQGDPGFDVWQGFYNGSRWLPPQGQFVYDDSADTVFARFRPAVVQTPLPSAVFLFASGLALLGWVRRKAR